MAKSSDMEMGKMGQSQARSQLSKQQIEYLRKHFSELDLNGDGHVTVSELSLMFKALKVKIEPETLKQLVRQADANGNGQIEFDEFVTLACQLKETDSTAWAQLLRRTKPGKMERAASATAEFFGVANPEALRTQQEMQHRSFYQRVDNPKSKSQQSMNGSAPPPLNKRQKTVSAFKSFVGIDQTPEEPADVTDDPAVQAQLRKRKPHTAFVILIISLAQMVMMAVAIILNGGIEPLGVNYMAGPSNLVLLHLGAKWAPCMRAEPWRQEATPIVRCPSGYEGPTLNGTHCEYYDVIEFRCGMGGWLGGEYPDQYWRFVTPIFLHTGLFHLAINLVFQIWRGVPIERDIGSIRMFLIYFISAIFGIAFGAIMAPNAISTGPSGALFSLLAILLIDLILNWKLAVSPVKNLIVLIVIIIFLLAIGILPFIDNFMHVGGFLAGILAACIFVPHINFGKWDAIRKKILVIVAIILLLGIYAIAFYTFYDGVETNHCSWCEIIDCIPPGTDWCATI